MRMVGDLVGLVLKVAVLLIVVIVLATVFAWRNLTEDDPTCPFC